MKKKVNQTIKEKSSLALEQEDESLKLDSCNKR